MNVLVTYYSQSGNTEKIAKAICEEAARTHNAELKKLENISPDDVAGYDFIFIGSPLHSGSLAAPVKDCLGVCRTIDIFSQIKAFLGNQAQPYS